jgi:DNA polymerase III subunit delta'
MKFSDVIGRQDVKNFLVQGVKDDRISHAQLFSGQEGGTSLPMAVAYACYIHCEQRGENDSCGTCSSCIKYRKLVHPDLHFSYPVVKTPDMKDRSPRSTDFIQNWREAFLENPYLDLTEWYDALGVDNKQGFMSVEESADIIRKLSLKSFESEFKILIMWLPEKMRPDASNKLLKIIEEPPGNTIFILVTHQRQNILPTILSRTQLVKIPKVSIAEMSTAIQLQFGKEPVQARKIANLADGNVKLAIDIVTDKEYDFKLENDFITWMRLCYSPFHDKNGKSAWVDLNAWIDQMAKTGRENMKLFFNFCLDACRECLIVNHGDSKMVRFDDHVIPNFSRFTRFIHAGNIEGITALLNKAHFAVERNANPRILLLDLSFKMNRLLNQSLEKGVLSAN